jgi:hypothetical protein
LATRDPKQENNQEILGKSQVPQTNLPVTRLHNSDKKQDSEKASNHMRVKNMQNRHKTKTQFYEHSCEQGETENFQNMILHRRKHAYIGKQ